MRAVWLMAPVLSALLMLPAMAAQADGDCRQFGWDVARERALFASQASALPAGSDSASAPALSTDRLYELALQPLAAIRFVTAPGRHGNGPNGYGGLATLRIVTAGTYRIAVDAPVWIDVVADGGLMGVKDFQGAHDCDAPRKILEFEFPVPREVILQISGADRPGVRIGVTRVAG